MWVQHPGSLLTNLTERPSQRDQLATDTKTLGRELTGCSAAIHVTLPLGGPARHSTRSGSTPKNDPSKALGQGYGYATTGPTCYTDIDDRRRALDTPPTPPNLSVTRYRSNGLRKQGQTGSTRSSTGNRNTMRSAGRGEAMSRVLSP